MSTMHYSGVYNISTMHYSGVYNISTMHYSGVYNISTNKVEQQRHVNSVLFMQRIMGTAPKPQLRPDVAQRAHKALVVFGD